MQLRLFQIDASIQRFYPGVDVKKKSRKKNIVKVRDLYCYMYFKFSGLSLETIARSTGNKNHATVTHSLKRTRNKIITDELFKQEIVKIEEDYFISNYDY